MQAEIDCGERLAVPSSSAQRYWVSRRPNDVRRAGCHCVGRAGERETRIRLCMAEASRFLFTSAEVIARRFSSASLPRLPGALLRLTSGRAAAVAERLPLLQPRPSICRAMSDVHLGDIETQRRRRCTDIRHARIRRLPFSADSCQECGKTRRDAEAGKGTAVDERRPHTRR